MKFFKAVAAVVLAGPATLAACQNIIATAQSAGFNTLVAAIDTAGLTDTFTQDGPGASVYTVFSPTDAAFLALPPGALTTLLKAENVELLTEILTYHVFSGAVLSTDLTDGQEVETLNPAANLTIGVDNTTETVTVTVNNVVVSPADVLADNGVIHVIDQVLLPPGLRLPLPSIVEIATSGDFPTLAAALQSTGLDDVLAGPGPFTVFVPTEGAFAKLPTRYLDLFVRNPVIFASLLFYHIVDGAYLSTDLQDEALLPTLLSAASLVVSINGTIMINDATVVTTDVAALNGVVHVIDTVLFPEGTHPPNVLGLVIATGLFSTFFEALEVTGLDVALAGSGPFTIFIPPEPAFAKLPAGTIESLLLPKNKELLVKILQQHFVYGLFYSSNITDGLTATALNNETLTFSETDAGMTVNGISLVSTDLTVINGVVHVVDEVIIPEDVMLPMSTILETTVADGNFATLSDVLDAAGLMAVLSGPGPFTVFAPTDAAFGDLPKALVYYLIQGDNAETLKALLTYHVVAGEFFSNDLSEGVPVLTLLGSTLDVSIMNGTVTINDATVTTADIDVSNGVIHVIDKVLVPDSITPPTLVDVGMADPMFETLVAAVTTAELVDALSGPGPLTLFAPTEAGFALLPAGTVEDLTTADDKTPLTEILLYHVVPELITAEAILNGRTSATTLRGANLTFSVMEMDGLEPHVVVNGVMVQGTAVAGNGIIHIISEVLTVPGDATIPAASPTIMAPTEDGALSTNSFVATLISGLSFAFAVLMN